MSFYGQDYMTICRNLFIIVYPLMYPLAVALPTYQPQFLDGALLAPNLAHKDAPSCKVANMAPYMGYI